MSAEGQSNVPSLIESRRSHTLLHDGPGIQPSTLQRLERDAELNVSLRGNRHSLPPDLLLPTISTTEDSTFSSARHGRDIGQPLDEATIANRTAALRRLNGVAPRHRRAESTRTRTSLSSQPIVVRTYSGSSTSRPQSDQRLSATMYDRTSMKPQVGLPSAEVFNFENILQAIEQEAREDVDAIAEICGRSKMSLANEYDAHMPPQGELMAVRPGGQPSAMGRSSLNQALTPVEEASSINEALSDSTQDIHHDVHGSYQHESNSIPSQSASPATRRLISISHGHVPSSASASVALATIPTKAQQKVLEQSTLPVMLYSDVALPGHEPSTTTLRESSSLSYHDDSVVSGKSAISTEQDVWKAPQGHNWEPRARAGVSDSNRRQSPLFGSLPPWLSWTNRSSHRVEYGKQASEMSAVSSLRSILATKGNQERAEDQVVQALA